MENHGNDKARGKSKGHRLFDDISAIQVTATALAAVTSMLLSNYIGFAGSVIGVAVASVVSTMAASLYKHFLAESAEKIKEIPVVGKPHSKLGDLLEHEVDKTEGVPETDTDRKTASNDDIKNLDEEAGSEKDGRTERAAKTENDFDDGGLHPADENASSNDIHKADTIPLDELSIAGAAVHLDLSEGLQSENAPKVENNAESHADSRTESSSAQQNTSVSEDLAVKSEESGSKEQHPESIQSNRSVPAKQNKTEHQKRLVRGLIIVCVVSALIAVAATAAIIYVASAGQGIGSKPQEVFEQVDTANNAVSKGNVAISSSPGNISVSGVSSSAQVSSSVSSTSSSSSSSSQSSSSSESSEKDSSSSASSEEGNESSGESESSSSDAESSSSSDTSDATQGLDA